MGNYSAIADTSHSIIDLLKSKLVPEPIKKVESIGICYPNNRGNYILGLSLYNIEENPKIYSNNINRVIDEEHTKYPPISVDLYYMVFAYSDSETIDEQKILGKVLQQLSDNSKISKKYLYGTIKENDENINIENINIKFDEKIKIWSAFNQAYKSSLFYKAGPIYIESDKVKNIKRVTNTDISIIQN